MSAFQEELLNHVCLNVGRAIASIISFSPGTSTCQQECGVLLIAGMDWARLEQQGTEHCWQGQGQSWHGEGEWGRRELVHAVPALGTRLLDR